MIRSASSTIRGTQDTQALADMPAAAGPAVPAPRPARNRGAKGARLAETRADLSYGQVVVIAARWILVATGLLLALWHPGDVEELKVQVGGLLLLGVANFYLHAQLLTRRPLDKSIAYATSVADIVLISVLVVAQGGYPSELYVFYFPAVLAFSVAFSTGRTLLYAGATIALYGLISLLSLAPAVSAAQQDSQLQDVVFRLLMLAAVAACGNVYWQVESQRREEAARLAPAAKGGPHRSDELPGIAVAPRLPEQEAAEDVFFGQVVTIWARWFLILSGAIVTLWTASTVDEVATRVPLLVGLMMLNCFLHARYVMQRPANRWLATGASVLDAVLVTGAVATDRTGLASQFFVFYFPVVTAFAFVMQPRASAAFTAAAVAAYTVICLANDPSILTSVSSAKVLVVRLIALGAVGGLATYYWRIQRDRRRAAMGPLVVPLPSTRAVGATLQAALR